MQHVTKNNIRRVSLCLCAFLITCCSGHTVLSKKTVADIPDAGYARIIKLYNPDGMPEKTLAGIVHVTGKATVCTDYPREEAINSLDDLTEMEKLAFPYFRNYAIEDGDLILGYVSVDIGYRIHIWRVDKDDLCKYRVQIIVPERSRGQTDHEGANQSVINW
ncbi:MAG: hypothetical protein R6W75_03635 [Smithellaceae bacterium]